MYNKIKSKAKGPKTRLHLFCASKTTIKFERSLVSKRATT